MKLVYFIHSIHFLSLFFFIQPSIILLASFPLYPYSLFRVPEYPPPTLPRYLLGSSAGEIHTNNHIPLVRVALLPLRRILAAVRLTVVVLDIFDVVGEAGARRRDWLAVVVAQPDGRMLNTAEAGADARSRVDLAVALHIPQVVRSALDGAGVGSAAYVADPLALVVVLTNAFNIWIVGG